MPQKKNTTMMTMKGANGVTASVEVDQGEKMAILGQMLSHPAPASNKRRRDDEDDNDDDGVEAPEKKKGKKGVPGPRAAFGQGKSSGAKQRCRRCPLSTSPPALPSTYK
ncbi:unnamed protein product [Discula destructiva]